MFGVELKIQEMNIANKKKLNLARPLIDVMNTIVQISQIIYSIQIKNKNSLTFNLHKIDYTF